MLARHVAICLLTFTPATLGCAGGGGGGGASSAAPASQVIQTEDAETPWITLGEDGRVVWFHADPVTGAPSGISMAMPDGREGYLAIDTSTGEPLYWSAEGWLVTFQNWRRAEGLVDVGFIGPDGERGVAPDMAYPLPEPDEGVAALGLHTMAAQADWANFFSVLTGAIGGAVCAGSVLITGGAAVAGVTFPPAGVPLFAATWTGTAWVCGTTALGLLALNADTAVKTVNDNVVAPANLGKSAVECVGLKNVASCLLGVGDAINFVLSGVAQERFADLAALFTGPTDVPLVFCCSGPRRVEQGASETWRAAIVQGLGTPPFVFTFSFGEPGVSSVPVSTDEYGAEVEHAYTAPPGTYAMTVTMVDDDGTMATAGKLERAHPSLTPFAVEVLEPLTATLQAPDSVEVGQEATFAVQLSGGPRPVWWTLELGDGQRLGGRTVADRLERVHTYQAAGPKALQLEIQDAEGTTLEVVTGSLEVTAPAGPPPDPACLDAKLHLCTNIQGQQCSTATMGNAVSKVSAACGAAEASRFAGVAEMYCAVTTFGSFTSETCAQQ